MGSKRKRSPKDVLVTTQPAQKRVKQKSEAPNGSSKQQSAKASKVLLDKTPFSERPAGEERKREALLYERLGSEDTDDRIDAAEAIIAGLLGEEAVSESVLHRHLANRLFRGLASGRNASRLGFSLVLTELLGQLFGKKDLAASRYPELTFDKVLQTLVEKTQPNGSIPGKEERDHYFGQLFGIECFVSANILFKDKSRWLAVLDLLLNLSEKKVWLRPQCGWVIAEAARRMKPKLASATLQKLADKGHGQTPEGVGIWVTAIDRFGSELKLPSKPWSDPLSAKSLPDLTQSLKDSGRDTSQDGEIGKPKHNNWTAQLHWVWDILLDHFKSLDTEKSSSAADFEQFWNKVVDDSFFSKIASDHQKFSGFMIFQKMLEEGATCSFIIDKIFSKNLMVCLMNQAAREDRFLHRAALKALKAVEATAQTFPSVIPTVLSHLLGKNGAYNFDQRTNTKTVEKVLQHTKDAEGPVVLDILKTANNLEPPQSIQAYANYLFKLASLPKESSKSQGDDSISLAGVALQKLAQLTYMKQDPDSEDANVRSMLQNKLSSAFARFVRRREDFTEFCIAVLEVEADVGSDEEINAEYEQALERLKVLLETSNVDEELAAPYQGLALLHAVGLLQLYNEEPDALDTLADLKQCYNKLATRDSEKDSGLSEFLVDTLLSMVAKQSSLMRQVCQQVFEAFTNIMSEEAIKLLTEPLTAEESEKGQQALFSNEDDDLAGEDDDEEDGNHDHDEESLDSDVEIVDLEDADSDEGMGDASEASDDEESEADKDAAETADGEGEALDNALAAVLKSHRLDKDAEAESEDDDDSDMSDSEMMELDNKLVEIFKQRAKNSSKKKDRKEAKQSVVDFKHRILDLLAIFVREEGPNYNILAFQTLLPLLELIRTTKAKPLANKACGIVLDFSKSLKKTRKEGAVVAGDVELDAILEILRGVHVEAGKDVSHVFARAASAASLACASTVCFATTESLVEDVFALYHETQLSWFKGEVKIQQSFFVDWLNWCQSHAVTAAAQKEA